MTRDYLEAQLTRMADAGVALQLRLLDDWGHVEAVGRARVESYDPDRHELHIDWPTHQGQPLDVRGGNRILLLFELGGTPYQFETVVLGETVDRIRELRIQVAEQLQFESRRNYVRIVPLMESLPSVRCRVLLDDPTRQPQSPWFDAQLHDLSMRGTGLLVPVESAPDLRPGMHLELVLTTPKCRKPIAVFGTVGRLSFQPDQDEVRTVGVAFEPTGDGSLREIAKLVVQYEREVARRLSRVEIHTAMRDSDAFHRLLQGTYHAGIPGPKGLSRSCHQNVYNEYHPYSSKS